MTPRLEDLPSVDELVKRLEPRVGGFPRRLLVEEARQAIDQARQKIRAGLMVDLGALEVQVEKSLEELALPSLRGVINATGVILHTNLGRAPLPAFTPIRGYSNLEYELGKGRRGKRDVHVGGLLEKLLGRPGIAVNNNAAAVYLALSELAAGREVLISRGELIEIGDGFRIPDIMACSGAVLREVGTTNRTTVEDYRSAFTERTSLILRVHPSNFRIQGFTARPRIEELAGLARERNVPLYEDLGSGCLADLKSFGVEEPLAAASLAQGANLISFSCDKLLGGPQAGILAGEPALITRLRRHPMFRALRVDKLIYQALEITLRHTLLEQWERLPALRMIRIPAHEIAARARKMIEGWRGVGTALIPGESVIGGGATPQQPIPTFLIAISGCDIQALEAGLRAGEPPVIARIEKDLLLLDLRTVLPEQDTALAEAVQARSR